MADADDIEQQEDADDAEEQKDSKTEESGKTVSGSDISRCIINMVVVIFVCGAAGFGLGRFIAGPHTLKTVERSKEEPPPQAEYLKADVSATDSQKVWYYDLEPVVANLDEPGATRYVRATLTLKISSEMDQKNGIVFLEEKKPLLANWLTIYLASLSIEDCRGNRKLKRIQSQMLDAFNEILFLDAKPQIKHILFKEFAIQ